MPRVITVQEAATRLDVCKATIVRAVRTGRLRARFAGLMKNRVCGIYEDSVAAIQAKTENVPTARGEA